MSLLSQTYLFYSIEYFSRNPNALEISKQEKYIEISNTRKLFATQNYTPLSRYIANENNKLLFQIVAFYLQSPLHSKIFFNSNPKFLCLSLSLSKCLHKHKSTPQDFETKGSSSRFTP